MSFDRRYEIWIDDKLFLEGGSGRQLRITFSLSVGFEGTHGAGDLAIFNLAESSRLKLKAGSIVTVKAGYVKNIGIIYRGRVANVLLERIGPDTASRLLMLGWENQNQLWSHNFPANVSVIDVIKKCASQAGYPLEWREESFESLPRKSGAHTVFQSDPINELRALSEHYKFNMAMARGKIVLNRKWKDQGGSVLEINEFSGMEMMPEVTDIGVDVMVRLDPRLSIGRLFEVTSDYATFTMANNTHNVKDFRGANAGKGEHTIKEISHEGDSWGDKWSTSIVGWANDEDEAEEQ